MLSILVLHSGNLGLRNNAKAIAAGPQQTTSEAQIQQKNVVAQFGGFGLPDLLDIPGAVDDKVNQIESNIRSRIPNILLPLIPEDLFSLEAARLSEFSDYFNKDVPDFEQQPADIRKTLETVAAQTGHRYAMVYVAYKEEGLEFLLFAPGAEPQSLYTADANQEQLTEMVNKFRSDLVLSLRRTNTNYLDTSQALYQALIEPLEAYLNSNNIDGLIFSMDQGLRNLPLAALHDGDRYLIEKYSLAMIPSFADINSDYLSLQKTPVLAMGAENFKDLEPLPGAALEINAIADITTGKSVLNEEFSVKNLTTLRSAQNFPIVHLATHAEFNAGSPKKSSIYLWNDELRLNDIDDLKLDNPPLELLVLSACQTAVGSKDAELGFAGLTIASGSKTALGSLWYVSDSGTLVLMQDFYNYLQTQSTKSEALRQAQLSMLKGELKIVDGQLRSTSGTRAVLKVADSMANFNPDQLTHPYYWSAFTLVGQPW
ncbi:MAG: CHAT domain-containing protein [Limnothrix sp.]